MYLDDGDDVMMLMLLGAALIGCLYLLAWLIYREIDFARARSRSQQKAREEEARREQEHARREHQAAMEREDVLADLRDYGISEYQLEHLPTEEIATQLRVAVDVHRRAIEGFAGARRPADALR